jgi:hypothetical protein
MSIKYIIIVLIILGIKNIIEIIKFLLIIKY